jgi:murein DD-endopeptidase MepM/ murein hydrolase activator NlpD
MAPEQKRLLKWVIFPLAVILITGLVYIFFTLGRVNPLRSRRVVSWIRDPQSHPDWLVGPKTRCLTSTPFLFPTEGYIGFLWDDSFRPGHRHQGIDIFSKESSGQTPVYAAYSGFLTRLPDWKSSVIMRIPEDPLHPGRQIWTYYTHMADVRGNSYIVDDFPAGTTEVFVEEGTLLGYQGNYSGTPGNPTGIHLHFSIVLDNGKGSFLNELNIQNTLDPSPYFDLPLNGYSNPDQIPRCDPYQASP